jgi:N-acetyl-alpha-D-muramate 1-phosphate uridylyltransferase
VSAATDLADWPAMVLAAGLGLRLRPLTLDRPKPLVAIAGQTLIDRVLDRIAAAGVRRVVVNTHHLGEKIAAHLKARRDLAIILSAEPERLETGGGVAKALAHLGPGAFFVVNGDSFWLDGPVPALRRLAAAWDESAMDALLLLHPTVSAVGYDGPGDFVMDQVGRLRRRLSGEVAPFVFGGIQILHARLFEGLADEPYSLNRIYDRALEAGRLYGLRHDGLWFHVGTPADLERVERELGPHGLGLTPNGSGPVAAP